MYGLISGSTGALVRFCYYVVWCAEALFIFDECMLPGPLKTLDAGHMSFTATLWCYHRHHNVCMRQAAELFAGPRDPAPSRAKTRWHLAYTLLKNPSLVRERGRRIAGAAGSAAASPARNSPRSGKGAAVVPVTESPKSSAVPEKAVPC